MRKLITGLALFLCAIAAQAQYVTITGTNSNYANGTVEATFQSLARPGQPFNACGFAIPNARCPQSPVSKGTLDGSGNFSINAWNNSFYDYYPSQTVFKICGSGSFTCYSTAPIVVTQGMDISSFLSAAPVPTSGGGSAAVDTRPKATTTTVGMTVAAGASCNLSVSPSTAGQFAIGQCNSGTATGPGTITHVHVTLGPAGDNANVNTKSTLTFNCDGNSTTVPFSLYFLASANPVPFVTDWIDNTLGQTASGNLSVNRRTEINYTSGCTVVFTNGSATSSVTLFGEVEYRIGANASRASRQHWNAYVQPITSLAAYANLQMLPNVSDANGGELESIELYGSNSANPYYLEGYTTVTADGQPASFSGGTEDFFGSGYYGVDAVGGHHTPKWGEFYASGVGNNPSLQSYATVYDTLFYRNYQTDDRDNLLFKNTLSAIQPNGQLNKPGPPPSPGATNMASLVTFWTHDPMAASPTFSPTGGVASPGATVTMSSASSGVTFCSTVDGSAPLSNGAGTCTHGTSGSTVSVTPPVTVNALATKAGSADSWITSASYTATYAAPTYRTQCNTPNGAGGSTTSSCTLTTTAGDFMFVACNGNVQGNTYTISSSKSETFHALTAVNNGSGAWMGGYAFNAVGGSTTVTCTASGTTGYQGIAVLDYAPGSLSTLAAQGPTVINSSVSTFTSATVSTSGSAFFIACGQPQYGPPTPTAGNINGAAATGRTMSSAIYSNCEDRSVTGAATNAVGTITGSSAGTWVGTMAAFQ